MSDIYFDPAYGKLYEPIEGGVCETFEYADENGRVRHMFIKRPVPWLVDGVQYYDITTPYGYGGPVAEGEDTAALCRAFGEAFGKHCREAGIVSEFVRFHPLYQNADAFREVYDPVCIRQTVGTDLGAYEDPVQSEFSKSCRKNIRQALRAGVEYAVIRAPEDIHDFKPIYYATMDRDHASGFYYFDDAYFAALLCACREDLLYVKAVYEGKTIAAGLCLLSDKTIYFHLSGTLSDYLYLSPACILRYAVTVWGKEQGYEMLFHGGGTTNSPEDTLLCFKRQFARNTQFDFCVGRKVYQPAIYQRLCALRESKGARPDPGYFPGYRG